jgi:hypothetical protein
MVQAARRAQEGLRAALQVRLLIGFFLCFLAEPARFTYSGLCAGSRIGTACECTSTSCAVAAAEARAVAAEATASGMVQAARGTQEGLRAALQVRQCLLSFVTCMVCVVEIGVSKRRGAGSKGGAGRLESSTAGKTVFAAVLLQVHGVWVRTRSQPVAWCETSSAVQRFCFWVLIATFCQESARWCTVCSGSSNPQCKRHGAGSKVRQCLLYNSRQVGTLCVKVDQKSARHGVQQQQRPQQAAWCRQQEGHRRG